MRVLFLAESDRARVGLRSRIPGYGNGPLVAEDEGSISLPSLNHRCAVKRAVWLLVVALLALCPQARLALAHPASEPSRAATLEEDIRWIVTHDYGFKLRHAREFLEQGNKVKAWVQFRGRDIIYKDRGRHMVCQRTDF